MIWSGAHLLNVQALAYGGDYSQKFFTAVRQNYFWNPVGVHPVVTQDCDDFGRELGFQRKEGDPFGAAVNEGQDIFKTLGCSGTRFIKINCDGPERCDRYHGH